MRPLHLLPAALLVACAHAGTTGPAQPPDSTLKAIKERKAILVGYLKDAYPLSFQGPNGPDGYSVDLCRRIAEEAGKAVGIEKLEVRYVPVTIDDRIDAVATGKVDIECGTTTATLARMEKVDFTNLTFVDGGGLAVRKGSNIRNMPGLLDESVAVVPGTTTEKALRAAVGQGRIRARLVEVSNHASGLSAVRQGTVSAYASDRVILAGLLVKDQERAFDLVPMQFSFEPYGMMLRRGDSEFRLVANRALSRTYRSSDIATIVERWFGTMGTPADILVVMYLLNATPE